MANCTTGGFDNSNDQQQPCPPLHSPLPYMLAGLIAMAVLVIVALVIVAWPHLRRRLHFLGVDDPESGSAASEAKAPGMWQESSSTAPKVIVILAGQDKPTHIAMPTSGAAT